MKALICVDLQNDFITGSLAVKKGEEVISVANRLITSRNFGVIVLTADYHPPAYKSFASNNSDAKVGEMGDLGGKPQVWWPDHCVWGTPGAEFHKNLLSGKANLILRKGMKQNVDSYSGFFDNDGESVGLAGYLKERGVTDVYIMGLATDYCVKFTALDSVKCEFNTYLVTDGCRAVNISDGDGDAAINEIEAAGVTLVQSYKLTKRS